MRSWWPAIAFPVLLFASAWTVLTIVTAVSSGEGHGGVFWTAIAMLVLLAALLVAATWRVGKRLRLMLGRSTGRLPS
jgi:hypothetical protein